jgi:tetratricopeptide (TPR) repeat protein
MEALKHAAELATKGHGQIVAVVAEAGVGKSRLLHEFKAGNQWGWMVLQAVSLSHGKTSPYLPVLDLLHSYFGFSPNEEMRKRREKITSKVLALDRSLDDALPYLFGLLGLIEGDDALAGMAPQIRQRRTHEAFKRILLRESFNKPMMLIFEDLHWVDDESQGFLNLLADSIGTAKLLLLVSYRPSEYSHQWNSKTYYTQLRLDSFGDQSAAEMLDALLGEGAQATVHPLAALKRLIIEKTEGTPLFMEEIIQSLQEDGVLVRNGTVKVTRPLDTLKIPPTVQDIIAARIDRLPVGDKEVLQTLSIIGMEFPLALVQEVIAKPDDELSGILRDLQLAEFIYEQPGVGDAAYTFKHPLTQEVAYNSVLLERRKAIHERIGAGIEVLFARSIDDHVSELARHYVGGNNIDKGVEYSFRAGKQAALQNAHGAAASLFRVALDLVRAMPETPARDRLELEVLNEIGLSLSVLKNGYSAPEVRATYNRGAELFRRLGDPDLHFALSGKWAVHIEANELDEALATAELALGTALTFRHKYATGMARVALGASLYYMGRFAEALSSLREGSLIFEVLEIKADALGHQLVGVTGLFLGATQQASGFHDSGLRSVTEAARSLTADAPLQITYAFFYCSLVHHLRGESNHALEYGESLIRHGEESALAIATASGLIARGDALAQRDHPDEGIAQLKKGFDSLRELNQILWTWCYFLLAEAYLKAGQYSEGLDSVAKGLARSNQKGEKVHDALLWWVRGELLVKSNDPGGGESSLRMAIDIARQQSAQAWELRATTSLARLLADQGKRDEARTMLADIYNWFTEGFDTADLKDAKVLLDELSA